MIGAVVLAAGRSRRMGRPKMILPWGETTIIGQVVQVLSQAQLNEIVVVTGGAQTAVETALRNTPVKTVFNPDFANDDMTQTLKVGLSALPESVEGSLVVLGDQPQIELKVVQRLLNAYQRDQTSLIVPSFERRRGHPWLVNRSLWPEIMQLTPPETMRDFLNAHLADTIFVETGSNSILQDLDTPDDYQQHRPLSEDSQ